MPAIVNLLHILGGLLFLLGIVSFLLGPQHSTSSCDDTQPLTQPICGGKPQAENGRIYLINEELCSVIFCYHFQVDIRQPSCYAHGKR